VPKVWILVGARGLTGRRGRTLLTLIRVGGIGTCQPDAASTAGRTGATAVLWVVRVIGCRNVVGRKRHGTRIPGIVCHQVSGICSLISVLAQSIGSQKIARLSLRSARVSTDVLPCYTNMARPRSPCTSCAKKKIANFHHFVDSSDLSASGDQFFAQYAARIPQQLFRFYRPTIKNFQQCHLRRATLKRAKSTTMHLQRCAGPKSLLQGSCVACSTK